MISIKSTLALMVALCLMLHTHTVQGDENIQPLARLGETGWFVAVKDHYVYTNRSDRIEVWDFADPAHTVKCGEFIHYYNDGMIISGNRGYVSDGHSHWNLYDLTNPAAPSLVTNLNRFYFAGTLVSSDITHVADAGNYVYISAASGMGVLDVKNPFKPAFLGGYGTTDTQSCDVLASGTLALILRNNRFFESIDVSHPATPALLGRLDLKRAALSSQMALAGGFVLVLDERKLHIIDISKPEAPALLAELSLPYTSLRSSGMRWGCTIKGNRAYLYGRFPLNVIDFSTPTAPRLLPEYPFQVSDIQFLNGLAITREAGSLVARDLNLGPNALPLGRAGAHMNSADYVEAGGGYAYVTDSTSLSVIDARQPNAPVEVGWLAGASGPMTLDGTRLILPGTDFKVSDVSNPHQPRILGHCAIAGARSQRGSLEGTRYYAGVNANQLAVVNLDRPSSPTVAALCIFSELTTATVSDYLVRSGLAYLLVDKRGLEIYDIRDPLHPVHLGRLADTSLSSRSLAMLGDNLFINWEYTQYGVTSHRKYIDISDPARPQLRDYSLVQLPTDLFKPSWGAIPVTKEIAGIHFHGNWGVVIWKRTYDFILTLYDFSNPAQLRELGWLDYPASSLSPYPYYPMLDAAWDSGILYATEGGNGLSVLRYTPPPSAAGGWPLYH